ncbi:MAG: polyphosphate kinase 1 [Kiritimatiellia bacterium]
MNMRKLPLLNRELSWLAFNERVLDEASDPGVPLLDRLLFFTITASNLDEFFMVRMGGLKLIQEAGLDESDFSGMTPAQQYGAANVEIRRILTKMEHLYQTMLTPSLLQEGLCPIAPDQLDPQQQEALRVWFENRIYPVLTPIALRPGHPIPLLANLGLYVLVVLAPAPRKRIPRFAIIPVPSMLSRFIPVSGAIPSKTVFVLLEEAIAMYAATLFPGISVRECIAFRTTRNADIHVDETYSPDLSRSMLRVLRQRKTSGCVRLEVASGASPRAMRFLQKSLNIAEIETYRLQLPLQINDFQTFYGSDAHKHLRYAAWKPCQPADVDSTRPLFEQITAQDLLLSHPYETIEPVVRFLDEAASDPDVLAIKMVLYRTGKDSPVITALQKAAESGKVVTALVELKARFDEENNIAWAEKLERSGVQVIYGIKGLKTHAKICMVVRREAEGIVRYLHIGTGNYNIRTAKLYTDVAIMTRNDEFGIDASTFFNTVCGYSEPQPYNKFVQAPIDLRQRLIELIDAETAQRAQGRKAQIIAKMNALVDPEVIAALYRASQAGVDIRLIVRGVCCLRPGLPGWSENIRVISIIDRYLEHSRIFYFHHGGSKQVYIASADWMTRNLSRRIELMIPIESPSIRKRLVAILKAALADNRKARIMQPDGTYKKVLTELTASASLVRSQESLYKTSLQASQQSRVARRQKFEPHLPPQSPSF